MSQEAPILQVENISKTYGERHVVKDLSFNVFPGEVVGLLGPNGAGKTTSFYMTIGLIRPDKGMVLFKGEDITFKPIYQRARMGMGYLAQEPSVFRELTVEDNLLSILETLPLNRQEQLERLKDLLSELNLTKLAKTKAAALSGGERRRLEITRALIHRPSFLLLDEPFANIDPISIGDLKALIRHLKKKKISVLITDHNAREIFSIVDRSYIIQEGKVLTGGTVDQLLASELAKKVYLGEDFKM